MVFVAGKDTNFNTGRGFIWTDFSSSHKFGLVCHIYKNSKHKMEIWKLRGIETRDFVKIV